MPAPKRLLVTRLARTPPQKRQIDETLIDNTEWSSFTKRHVKNAATLGATVRSLRIFYKLTQEELAQKLNIRTGQVSRIERDLILPRPDLQLRFAEVFQCDPMLFFAD